jgi:hypothetical protein
MNVGHYSKAIVTILAAGLGILTAALSDGQVNAVETVNVIIAILTAVGVYLVPNLEKGAGAIAKTIVAFGGAALATLALILGEGLGWGDVTSADWLGALLAGLAAIGVYIVPNETSPERVVAVGAVEAAPANNEPGAANDAGAHPSHL